MSVQREQDDQVRNRGQDDGRGAEPGPAHEELACDDWVAETGYRAEGQGERDAVECVAEAADLDEAGASQDKDEGQGEIDDYVVREEGDSNDEGEPDAAFAVNFGEGGHGVHKGEDCENAKAKEDDCNAEDIDCVPDSAELYCDELVGALDKEEVEEDFAANIEHKAEVDCCTTAAFGSEVPSVYK